MFAAKKVGGSRYAFFEADMHDVAVKRLAMTAEEVSMAWLWARMARLAPEMGVEHCGVGLDFAAADQVDQPGHGLALVDRVEDDALDLHHRDLVPAAADDVLRALLAAEREVVLVPVLFAAILAARGQKGPAEIPGKREFTYRHVLWQARAAGVPLTFPPSHPFNPIAALRLCIAAGSTARAVDALFDWIWAQGRAGNSIQALAAVSQRLGVPPAAPTADAVKAALRSNTDAALAAGVFGVPTLQVGDALFWGNDAHAFAMAALADPAVLDDAEMRRIATLPIGATRAS